mmetsp:Transcript_14187/g.45317  ORF Transcript_14187/g.45317 Transcript_14187/m.45317 type:complete len:205 (-) Transcript_14187:282-896(-)
MSALRAVLCACVLALACSNLDLLTPDECERHESLWGGIHADLMHWAESGITEELMEKSLNKWSTRGRNNAISFVIIDGVPYISRDIHLDRVFPWHRPLLTNYIEMMLDLSNTTMLPNVEFNVHSQDVPMVSIGSHKDWSAGPPLPLMRFCKKKEFGDILVPYSHFVTKNYDEELLTKAKQREINRVKWKDKSPTLVPGKYNKYE